MPDELESARQINIDTIAVLEAISPVCQEDIGERQRQLRAASKLKALIDKVSCDLPKIDRCEMSQWQPIETAPKDGTWVLLLIPESCQESDRPKPWVEAAHWVEEYFEHWDQVSPDRKERRIEDNSHWSCYETATHWAPMPQLPSEPQVSGSTFPTNQKEGG